MFKKIYITIACLFSVALHSTPTPVEPLPFILISTVPKSGTHLLLKAVTLCTGVGADYCFYPKTFDPKHGKVLQGHLWALQLNHTAHNFYFFDPLWKKIIHYRDPRDTLVSQVFWILKSIETNHPNFGWNGLLTPENQKAFVEGSVSDRITILLLQMPSPWNINWLSREAWKWKQKWQDNPQVLVTRFEDLVGPQGGGCREAQRQTVKDLLEFTRRDASEESIDYICSHLFGNSNTFREGKIGSWEQCFSEENKCLFKELMGDLLIEMGYEQDYSW